MCRQLQRYPEDAVLLLAVRLVGGGLAQLWPS